MKNIVGNSSIATQLLKYTCTIPLCVSSFQLSAQEQRKEFPLVSIGTGLNTFHGDVGNESKVPGAYRNAFRLGIEQKLGNWIGLELNASYGKLSRSERSLLRNRNFETPILYTGLNTAIYFDNDFLLSKRSSFKPYLKTGFGWFSFDPHGDLKDAGNNTYYYWSDGSIRNIDEHDSLAYTAVNISRDYNYETQLKDSLNNYTRSSFAIPLSAGFRFAFTRNFGADFNFTYYISFTDYIDNVKFSSNDHWRWAGISLYYKFGYSEKSKEKTDPEFEKIYSGDSDGDGVKDMDDKCPDTPQNTKTDANGCPLESPGKKETATGSNGQQTNCIPEEFRAADANNDCVITADEINKVIDNFFDGIGDWTADKINRLIDYFFEQ